MSIEIESMEFKLANGQGVEVSIEEIQEFITNHAILPNPYWRHGGLLTDEEVTRFLNKQSTKVDLLKIARYFLVYTENLSFAAYLFDKAAGKPEQGKEFNMPAVKKLRELYQKVRENNQEMTEVYQTVYQMENTCMEIGAGPL